MTVIKLTTMENQFDVQDSPEAVLVNVLSHEDPMSIVCVTDVDGDAFYFERSTYAWHQLKKTARVPLKSV